MKVVYADFTYFNESGKLWLTGKGSVDSINVVRPEDGERVVLTDGELYVTATIRKNDRGQYEAVNEQWAFRTSEE